MSVKSWKAEFYPSPPNEKATWRECLEHSIRKWTGLLPDNMAKHAVWAENAVITDVDSYRLGIDASSCALCQKGIYLHLDEGMCTDCPLYAYLGKRRCDDDAQGISPYSAFCDSGDAQPMLDALKAARKFAPVDLGTANGWRDEPELYTLHRKECTPYTLYSTREHRLGNCYYKHCCDNCYISWKVDSSD